MLAKLSARAVDVRSARNLVAIARAQGNKPSRALVKLSKVRMASDKG